MKKLILMSLNIIFLSLFAASCGIIQDDNKGGNQNNENNNNSESSQDDNSVVINNKIKLQSFVYELAGDKLTITPKNDIEINKCDNKKHLWKYIGEGDKDFVEIKGAQDSSLEPITVNLTGFKHTYFVYFIVQCNVDKKVVNYEYIKTINTTVVNSPFNSVISYEIFNDGIVKTNIETNPAKGSYTHDWLFDVDLINNKQGPDYKNYKTKEAVSQFNSNGNKYIKINSEKDGFDSDEVAFNVLIENSTAPDIPINPDLPLGLKVTRNGYLVNVELVRTDTSKNYYYSKIEVDFGDGEIETDKNGSKLKFEHRYKNIGKYKIKAVATQRTNMCDGIYCPETQTLEGEVEIVFNKSAIAYIPNDNNIYVVFYVKGQSSYAGPGGFNGFRNYEGAYARDFNFEYSTNGVTNVRFCGSNECMTKYKNEVPNSINDLGGYTKETGFTDSKGTYLSVPGYIYDKAGRLKVSKSGGSLSGYFSITDASKQGQLMGDIVFTRGDITFNVNKTYNPQTEKNIAVFELDCVSNNDRTSNPCVLTFKEFEKKN